MTPAEERVRTAIRRTGGSPARAAAMLFRWAGVLRANDPNLSRALMVESRRLTLEVVHGDDLRTEPA